MGNGTPQPLNFHSFSLRSFLFFLQTLVFDGLFSVQTPITTVSEHLWGVVAPGCGQVQRDTNWWISHYLTLCATPHTSFLAIESRKEVGAWFVYKMLGRGKAGMGRWRQAIQMLWEQLFKTAWRWPKLSLRLTVGFTEGSGAAKPSIF